MTKRRVVVTGLGIVSPLGSTVASAWEGILAGRSGIGPITRFDVSAFATRFGGEVSGFNVEEYLNPKEARKMDPFMHYGFGASDPRGFDAWVARLHEGDRERVLAWLDAARASIRKATRAKGFAFE